MMTAVDRLVREIEWAFAHVVRLTKDLGESNPEGDAAASDLFSAALGYFHERLAVLLQNIATLCKADYDRKKHADVLFRVRRLWVFCWVHVTFVGWACAGTEATVHGPCQLHQAAFAAGGQRTA
jgi:hypothetical protein